MTKEEFAKLMGKRYGVEVDVSNLPSPEVTGYEFITAIFPKEKVIEWLEDNMDETKELRKKFNLIPYDKFDKEIKEEIAKLKAENNG